MKTAESIMQQLRLINSDEEIGNFIRWIIKSDAAKEYYTSQVKPSVPERTLENAEEFFKESTGQRFGEINMKILAPETIFKAMDEYRNQSEKGNLSYEKAESIFNAGRERIDHPDFDFVYDDFDAYVASDKYPAQPSNGPDIIALEKERMEWALKIFPQATAISSLRKLEGEIKEVESDINSGAINSINEEYADCLMCLFDSAGRLGITPQLIFEAFAKKVEKNKNRKWVKNPDNTYSHVKEEGKQ